ncbi:hypothetical protein GWK08_06320 [Leptobacterium flavescens]|uniref:Uncharacterized protein n=1 Tax=Leptobacterium flavescens TaxID=472055 RepID=A0A6P0URP0_9FLAO|nr:hypothetical protein [Leptobacterium flavescens]NER13046.1 hypothetical protein [Leptobacterium flavescens]
MKKKKLKNLVLHKSKIADLNTMRSVVGGSNACNAESVIICESGDTGDGGGGGGGTGAQSIIDCQQTQLCGPTQQTCGCASTTATVVDC